MSALALALALASCSRQISYRDAYKFGWHTYKPRLQDSISPLIAMQPAELKQVLLASSDNKGQGKQTSPEKQRVPVARITQVLQPDTAIVHTAGSDGSITKKPNPKLNWTPGVGLVMLLTGVFYWPLAVLGFILCLIGLRSEKRKLAVVVLTILGVLSFILLVLAALVLLSDWGGVV